MPDPVIALLSRMQEQLSAQDVVLKALIDSHPDKARLLAALDIHIGIKRTLEEAAPILDSEIESLQRRLAAWRRLIEGG